MVTREEIESLAKEVDRPELAAEPGMVHQVWQDGEVTLQKSGELLWQRTLHCDKPAVPGAANAMLEFPHRRGSNSYAWVTEADALRVRELVKELALQIIRSSP